MSKDMTLRELQVILGERIRIAVDTSLTIEERAREAEISQRIGSIAKQMINNADVVLRAEKLISEGRLRESNIAAMIGGTSTSSTQYPEPYGGGIIV